MLDARCWMLGIEPVPNIQHLASSLSFQGVEQRHERLLSLDEPSILSMPVHIQGAHSGNQSPDHVVLSRTIHSNSCSPFSRDNGKTDWRIYLSGLTQSILSVRMSTTILELKKFHNLITALL
jgi:hypothetical protein